MSEPLFVALDGARPIAFSHPKRIIRAERADQCRGAIAECDAALEGGAFVAGYLSYELGCALAGIPFERSAHPLLTIGVFDAPARIPSAFGEPFVAGPLCARIDRGAYDVAIARIAHAIHEGDVYQVNYTIPFDFAFRGSPRALYKRLREATRAPHAAYFEHAGFAIASWSPELFLEIEDGVVRTRPMKGTAALDRIGELESEKNRAEHVMIVDLLRNDLHRMCTHVWVEDLLTVERYPTFATLTSTIAGRLQESARLSTILDAAFPCGSVTGAPKIAAMQAIGALERDPRGAYTGALGYMSPDGNGRWNVAIRTAQIDVRRGAGRFDAGGGIVADSDAAGEWHEIALKRAFFAAVTHPVSIVETFALGMREGAHLARLHDTAERFGYPYDLASVRKKLDEARAITSEPTLVRVTLERDGTFAIQTSPLLDSELPVRICRSTQRLHSDDFMLQYKTTWRPTHDRALQEARQRGCFDALLFNERGEVAEGARSSVFARIGGSLFTPPRASGCLPGILRAELIASGRATERVLLEEDLRGADEVFVGNSARGLLPAQITDVLSAV